MLIKDKGIAAAITAPLFIALSILLSKMAGQHVHGLLVAGLGSLAAVPMLLAVTYFLRQPVALGNLWKNTRSEFLQVLITRAIFGQALIITGFTMTSAVKSILLLRLEPIFVFIWSMLLLKEKATPGKVSLLALLIFGSALVVWPADSVSALNLGDGLILLSLLFLSYSYMPTKKLVEQSSAIGLNLVTGLIGGAVVSAVAVGVYGVGSIPLTADAWAAIAGYSLTFPVVGASLYYYAFRTVKPWIVASFLSLEVIYGLALAAVLLAEKPTLLQGCGALILLAATMLIAMYRKREEAQRTSGSAC